MPDNGAMGTALDPDIAHVAVLNADGVIVSVNQPWSAFAAARRLRCPDFGVGLSYLDVCRAAEGPDRREAHRAAEGISHVLAGDADVFSMEYYCGHGSQRDWFRMIALPTSLDGGRGAVVAHLPITRYKESERHQRESEERLRQATRLAGLGYWLWDSIADRCHYCSEEHAGIHGLSVAEYLARSASLDQVFSLTHPDDRERYKDLVRQLRLGKSFEAEYRIVRPTGETRYVREIAAPIFDDRGRVVQEHGTIQDITAAKETEAQLLYAQRIEAVGQLTGGVAHDFNNLLSIITGHAELLSDRIGAEDPSIRAVLQAANRGAELTQHLLAFARKQHLSPSIIDLNASVGNVVALLQRTLPENIRLDTELISGLWQTLADPAQVENAVLNLAINARDAMPSGGCLTIATANRRLDGEAESPDGIPAGDYVSVTVRDTGIGIPASQIDKVFQPFFTTKEVGEGSGLGLSMVYGFAKQSGGGVCIRSRPNDGTEVTMYLPRVESRETAEGHEDNPVVLLVEDDAEVRGIIGGMLRRLGYPVVDVADAAGALSALNAERRIDFMLSDLSLPGSMDGRALAREVRRLRPDLGILFCSGNADALPVDPDDDVASIPVLAKPFRKDDLARYLLQAGVKTAR